MLTRPPATPPAPPRAATFAPPANRPCPLCRGAIKPTDERGTYEGTTTHRLCAVEQRLNDLEQLVERLRGRVA